MRQTSLRRTRVALFNFPIPPPSRGTSPARRSSRPRHMTQLVAISLISFPGAHMCSPNREQRSLSMPQCHRFLTLSKCETFLAAAQCRQFKFYTPNATHVRPRCSLGHPSARRFSVPMTLRPPSGHLLFDPLRHLSDGQLSRETVVV